MHTKLAASDCLRESVRFGAQKGTQSCQFYAFKAWRKQAKIHVGFWSSSSFPERIGFCQFKQFKRVFRVPFGLQYVSQLFIGQDFRYQCNEGPLSTCQTICHCNIFSSTSHHESPDIGELLLIQAHFVHFSFAESKILWGDVRGLLAWGWFTVDLEEAVKVIDLDVEGMEGARIPGYPGIHFVSFCFRSLGWRFDSCEEHDRVSEVLDIVWLGANQSWYTSSQDADQLARAKAWNWKTRHERNLELLRPTRNAHNISQSKYIKMWRGSNRGPWAAGQEPSGCQRRSSVEVGKGSWTWKWSLQCSLAEALPGSLSTSTPITRVVGGHVVDELMYEDGWLYFKHAGFEHSVSVTVQYRQYSKGSESYKMVQLHACWSLAFSVKWHPVVIAVCQTTCNQQQYQWWDVVFPSWSINRLQEVILLAIIVFMLMLWMIPMLRLDPITNYCVLFRILHNANWQAFQVLLWDKTPQGWRQL